MQNLHTYLSFISYFLALIVLGQPNTEVYLMNIIEEDNSIQISNFKNISNRAGYDNQPSFISDSTIAYVGTTKDNTDIFIYHTNSDEQLMFNHITSGGEYSPQPIPNKNSIAAVRLDTTGLQRLYAYDTLGKGKLLFTDLEVAYYTFNDENRIIASVLSGDRLDLVIGDIEKDKAYFYIDNSGRSIHKVPDSESVSYTLVNEEGNHEIYLLNIDEDGESFFVTTLPVGVQDHIWLSNSKLLLGSGDTLYMMDLFMNTDWVQVADLSKYNISDITRMAVSPNGKHLAIVAMPDAE